MFTGIVEETGILRQLKKRRGSVVFTIEARKVINRMRVGDSIAVEGACLTVTGRRKRTFQVQAVEETLKKTTLGRFREGDRVNLERPLAVNALLGGHFVLGHVDGVARVEKIQKRGSSWMFWIASGRLKKRLLIPVGSVAINGVSLTIAVLKAKRFAVSIIPHTWNVTTFRSLKAGDSVNIEYDVLGKYVVQSLGRKGTR